MAASNHAIATANETTINQRARACARRLTAVPSGGECPDVPVHAIDDLVRRRRAGREADRRRVEEPFRPQLRFGLDVMDARTVPLARHDQLTRVIAVHATDNDDDIAAAREVHGSLLALFRGMTDGVDDVDVGVGESPPDQRDQFAHRSIGCVVCAATPIRGCSSSARTSRFVQHDVESVEVVGQAPHLHVAALADNHGVVAAADERLDGPVRHVHERTRRFDHLESLRACASQHPLGGAVRRHHHRVRSHIGWVAGDDDAPGSQVRQDRLVMHQVAEDGQRSRRRRAGAPCRWRRERRSTCPDGSARMTCIALYYKVCAIPKSSASAAVTASSARHRPQRPSAKTPLCPSEYRPGCGKTASPCGPFPTLMRASSRPSRVSNA